MYKMIASSPQQIRRRERSGSFHCSDPRTVLNQSTDTQDQLKRNMTPEEKLNLLKYQMNVNYTEYVRDIDDLVAKLNCIQTDNSRMSQKESLINLAAKLKANVSTFNEWANESWTVESFRIIKQEILTISKGFLQVKDTLEFGINCLLETESISEFGKNQITDGYLERLGSRIGDLRNSEVRSSIF